MAAKKTVAAEAAAIETVETNAAEAETVETVVEVAAEEKKAPKKTAAKKTTTRKTTKKDDAETAEKETTTKKTTTRRKKAKPTVMIQYAGKEIVAKDILEAATKAFQEANADVVIETIELYIKPEEGVAYYVVNGAGSEDYKVEL